MITATILDACLALTLADGECAHVHADGRVTTGTDGASTHPGDDDWGDIVATWHPSRASDPWDCFAVVGLDDADVQALSEEAAAAGDLAQVEVCTRALGGEESARIKCRRAILAAQAMAV